MTMPLRILFLCTGNSCRSQMAEGFARHLGGGIVEASSAGIEAHGQNPRAIRAMAEIGIDISGQESTVVTDGMIEEVDLVVTVCGHADAHCPVLPPGVEKLHWPFDDPAQATGSEEEIMTEFRRVRDEIGTRIEAWLRQLERDRS